MSRDLDAPAPGAGGVAGGPGRRLVVVRHGRTAWNAAGRAQGHADVALDGLGHAQAAAAAPYLASLGPTRIWTSDLARARQTCGYLEEATGVVAEVDPRLREFGVGVRQGLTIAEFAERFPAEHASWASGDGKVRLEGAELPDEVLARMLAALGECLAGLEPGETGLVVTHGACLKVGVVGLLGWPASLAPTLRGIDNCAWVTLEELDAGGPLRMGGYNESVRPGHTAPQRLPDEG
ncbi:histidine phosphatase family protein [Nocardioides mesophilus]|uniref:Histidine phosphatase family protein n=1 Tax=Nocardioides mesophilus TaxID=433659 RepID=A0A7G9RCQ2_9ACTN|nr:histidine phosphatase family protein [Nocardioides mesophilus]QNN53377.1 histidine phosphatase family protein [Nocardioides mesophilus]